MAELISYMLLAYPGIQGWVFISPAYEVYFSSHTMNLVYIWYDDRYLCKVLSTTIPTPARDLKVKVTDLEL